MYKRKQEPIQAIQLISDIKFGKDTVFDKGYWIVVEGDKQFFLADEEFKEQFVPAISSPKSVDDILKDLATGTKTTTPYQQVWQYTPPYVNPYKANYPADTPIAYNRVNEQT